MCIRSHAHAHTHTHINSSGVAPYSFGDVLSLGDALNSGDALLISGNALLSSGDALLSSGVALLQVHFQLHNDICHRVTSSPSTLFSRSVLSTASHSGGVDDSMVGLPLPPPASNWACWWSWSSQETIESRQLRHKLKLHRWNKEERERQRKLSPACHWSIRNCYPTYSQLWTTQLALLHLVHLELFCILSAISPENYKWHPCFYFFSNASQLRQSPVTGEKQVGKL